MVTVEQAEGIIAACILRKETEFVSLDDTPNRILAGNVVSDRDQPPFNRSTVDGIAIRFDSISAGKVVYNIIGTLAAGAAAIELAFIDDAIEIMTGAAVPDSADTVIPYEQIVIKDGTATILSRDIRKGQNIHRRAVDAQSGSVVLAAGTRVDAAAIAILATVGIIKVQVYRQPRVAIITTGNEVVSPDREPTTTQIRGSNAPMLKTLLSAFTTQVHLEHVPDDTLQLQECLMRLHEYDMVILCGGVSMGKYDLLPEILMQCGVERKFHKIKQRPGKPFWFGVKGIQPYFALPGNPVSVHLCMTRYILPWLASNFGIREQKTYAILAVDVHFEPELQYFMQVTVTSNAQGQLMATPVAGNGSGDLFNLSKSDGYLELPMDKKEFKAEESYRFWRTRVL